MTLMAEGRAHKGVETQIPLVTASLLTQITHEAASGPGMEFRSLEVSCLRGASQNPLRNTSMADFPPPPAMAESCHWLPSASQ